MHRQFKNCCENSYLMAEFSAYKILKYGFGIGSIEYFLEVVFVFQIPILFPVLDPSLVKIQCAQGHHQNLQIISESVDLLCITDVVITLGIISISSHLSKSRTFSLQRHFSVFANRFTTLNCSQELYVEAQSLGINTQAKFPFFGRLGD